MFSKAIRFWYFGEVFLLLHFCGLIHASWWWIILFYLIDTHEYINWKKEFKPQFGDKIF